MSDWVLLSSYIQHFTRVQKKEKLFGSEFHNPEVTHRWEDNWIHPMENFKHCSLVSDEKHWFFYFSILNLPIHQQK